MSEIVDFFISSISNFLLLIKALTSSLFNGLQFFFALFTNVPSYIFNVLYGLPSFFRIGLFGCFGLVLLIIIFKLIAIAFVK